MQGHRRAAHLRVLSKLLQHHLGESGMAKLKAEHPELGDVLAPTLAPLAWVELQDLVNTLEHARNTLASGSVPRKVGRGTMSATFARLFGADPTSLAAETVLAALPTFWARYHDWGGVEAIVRGGSAEIVLDGYAGSTDVCALVGAELERIVELTGTSTVASMHPKCRITGAARCEFRVTWAR